MTVVGRLERVDVGMGAWVLVTPDGRRFQLDGAVPDGLTGSNVVATGEQQPSHGFAMLAVDGTLVLTAALVPAAT